MAGLFQSPAQVTRKEELQPRSTGLRVAGTTLLQIAARLSSPLWLQSMHRITGDKSFGVKPHSCSRT